MRVTKECPLCGLDIEEMAQDKYTDDLVCTHPACDWRGPESELIPITYWTEEPKTKTRFAIDLERDLMDYVLKNFGRNCLLDNHHWRSEEVNQLYFKLRALDVGTVIAIISDGGPDYEKHIRYYLEYIEPLMIRNRPFIPGGWND